MSGRTITVHMGPVTCRCGRLVRMPEFQCVGCNRDASECQCGMGNDGAFRAQNGAARGGAG